jgi:hypothetical protein
MPRKPELSATQLVASGLATVTATVGASYLGVVGTLWGAAFMSVASTAGVAIYKHYLEQGREQIQVKRRFAQRQAEEATSADPTRTVVWPAGTEAGDPTQLLTGVGIGREEPPPQQGPARETVGWLKHRWLVLAAGAVSVFAVVMGGVTLVEALAGKPVSTLVGASSDSGTSFGNVGKSTKTTPSQTPTSDVPTEEPSGGTTPEPSTQEPIAPPTTVPTPAPTQTPTQQPSQAPSSVQPQTPGE